MTPQEITQLREEIMQEQLREQREEEQYQEKLTSDYEFAVDEIFGKHNIIEVAQKIIREMQDIGWEFKKENLLTELNFML